MMVLLSRRSQRLRDSQAVPSCISTRAVEMDTDNDPR